MFSISHKKTVYINQLKMAIAISNYSVYIDNGDINRLRLIKAKLSECYELLFNKCEVKLSEC